MVVTKKQELFYKLNEAFANRDFEFIGENITDDVTWTMAGSPPIQGKSEFINMLEANENVVVEMTINKLITHGLDAAMEGKMKVADRAGDVKDYSFCNVYRLNKFKDGLVKEITEYIIKI